MKIQPDRTPILESLKFSKPARRPRATKAEAEAMDREAVHIVGEMRSIWLRLGSLIRKMIDARAYEVLAFPSMHAWMNARLGQSISSALSAVRSVRALEGVAKETLERIGERNAHMLTHLPEKERKSDEWIDKAVRLPTKEFKQQVRTALAKRTGMLQEGFKTWSVALPEKVYESMCKAEKKLAWSLEIDIEDKPGSRILVWEAFAQWILLTDEQTIKTQTQGM